MAEAVNKIFNFYNEVPVTEELQRLVHPSEKIQFSVKTIRDVAVFTDKRMLIADKQGLTGKKVEYYSIPYKSIVTYAIETAGTFDLDSEIKLTLSGGLNIELKFFKDKKMDSLLFKVYHTITEFMFG
ncbi:PH domain-containing protein [Fonticella tunisiensis]|uniref:PH (Pleckstrin Homology) domain-containing protein n=1 Tax=Fonticella tunisiensis TaxID=1096341 RepID=A0A4R7KSN2_9CLOT|nr:PH domain-containing protein [Fonticella tunisiensis]TDT62816.1 PH (Pleckstrin Homology) domain-containing protein [Fonticella tunisiensis]